MLPKLSVLSLPVAVALGLAVLVAPTQVTVASAAPASAIVDSPIDEVIDSAIGPDGTVYAVGGFGEVGAATGGLARLSTSSAQVDRSFLTVNGIVRSIITDPAGRTYLGGDFISVGGQPRNGLARLNADGSLDSTWAPSLAGGASAAYALTLDDTTLFFGGFFSSVNGQARQNLAAVDTISGQVLPWTPDPDNAVMALAADDTALYVGGAFTTPTSRLASYSLADLTRRTGWNPTGANQAIYALAAGNGVVYAGGDFSTIATAPRDQIAALDATTGAATAWNPDVSGTFGSSVGVITVDDTLVYIGGNFNSLNGGTVSRNRVAALNTDDTGTPTAWNPNVGPSGNVTVLEVTDSAIYIGGAFEQVGGTPRAGLARVDASLGALDVAWDAGVPTSTSGAAVYSLLAQGSDVVVGGSFTHLNVIERNGAAAFDSQMRVTPWNPDMLYGTGYAIELSGSTAYVVGDFGTVNGSVTRDYAAAFRTDDTGTVTSWNPQPDSYPYDMVIEGNLAYLVGDFGDVGGTTRNYAAAVRIDDAGTLTPWDPDLDSAAYSIALDGNVAYMVGDFNTVNSSGVNASRYTAAAVRTDDTGSVTAWDPDLDSNAYGVAVADGIVYLVGGFQYVYNTSINPVMRFGAAAFTTEDTGVVTEWDPYVDGGTPYDIEIVGDYAYLGGDFDNLNGGSVVRQGLAALSIDDTGTVSQGWNPTAAGGFGYGASYEGGLSVLNGRLAVMGSFRMATLDGVDYPGGLAVLPIPGSPVPPTPTPAPAAVPGAPRDVTAKPGDAHITVTWQPPLSTGSFSVSTYRVTAQPGGQICLTNEQTCMLTGLTNGREYAVTVAALSGAGWGNTSEPVYATAGSASAIQITGSRDGRMIRISGTSTELGMGAELVPWFRFPGQTTFTRGAARILVDVDGDFTWQRTTGKRIRAYVETPDGSLRSNAVTIPTTSG